MSAPGFEFFKSTDAGAPALYGAPGRMIALLDWALVGKGGWAKAFTGSNAAAYRSATGNRFYLKVDDTQDQLTRLRGYRAMTSITAGSDAFPATAFAALAEWGTYKSASISVTPRRYWGIRTNRYVMIVIEPSDGSIDGISYTQPLIFGDAPSMCELDGFNTVILGAPYPASTSFPLGYMAVGSWTISGAAQGVHMAATPSGGTVSPSCVLVAPCATSGTSYTVADVATEKSGRLQLQTLSVLSAETAAPASGAGILRAWLPNIKLAVGQLPRAGLAVEEVVTAGGKSYLLLQNERYQSTPAVTPSASGFMALETTDTDGAL